MKKRKTAKIDIDLLAKLASLNITDKEKVSLSQQLSETIKYIDILDELDTGNIASVVAEPQPLSSADNDQTEKSFTQEEALANASKKERGYFETGKVKWE